MEGLSLAEDLFLAVPDVDNQEKVHDELFEEVDVAKLEDEASSLAENPVDGNLLQASVVSDIVSELVNVLNHGHVAVHKHAPVVSHLTCEVFHAFVQFVFFLDIDFIMHFHVVHLVILSGALSLSVLPDDAVFFLVGVDQLLVLIIWRALHFFENKVDLGELRTELVFQ